jgi:hypothetical protein
MQLRKVGRIEKTSSTTKANQMLAEGWDLFAVIPKSPQEKTLGVVYVLVEYEDE